MKAKSWVSLTCSSMPLYEITTQSVWYQKRGGCIMRRKTNKFSAFDEIIKKRGGRVLFGS